MKELGNAQQFDLHSLCDEPLEPIPLVFFPFSAYADTRPPIQEVYIPTL